MAGYTDAVKAIQSYYAGTQYSDIWYKICQNKELTSAEIEAIKKVPFVETVYANDGSIRTWTYSEKIASAENYAGTINSNAQVAEYAAGSSTGARINATATQTAGRTSLSSGATKISTGTKVASVANKAFLATAAVAAGTWLGKTIDETLYSVNPSWWDEHLPSINPQTWDSIATTEGGKNFINTLFGIESDDSSQMYIPEEMLALAYMTLLQNGAYSGGGYQVNSYNPQSSAWDLTYPNVYIYPINFGFNVQSEIIQDGGTHWKSWCEGGTGDIYAATFSLSDGNIFRTIFVSDRTFVYKSQLNNGSISSTNAYRRVIGGVDYFYAGGGVALNNVTGVNVPVSSINATQVYAEDVIKLAFNGDMVHTEPLPGVSDTPGATQIDPSLITATDPAGVLTQLKSNYPSLFDGSVRDKVLQDDGTVKNREYVPVPYIKDKEQPTTGDQTQLDPKVNPEDPSSEELVQDLIIKTDPVDPEPVAPDTGTGDSPTVVTPTGSASSLWAVYNPTQAQVDAFGAWLWSSNLVDQIKKLFNDPMQAIIGVHKVFATPATGAAQNIKVGYLDSGVSSAVVTDQYTTIDCGTVNVREYYGNVLDYAPLTEISLFLPFIGIVKLDPADVMRGAVSVKYRVDVITGACLAEVRVNRDTFNPVMYTYAGSAIVSYPISSGSYASAVTGALSIAAGVAGTIASGGALAPALIGGALGATHLHANVQHSGSFSGCAGAMGGKKPYLIRSRPQSATPYGFETIQGKPAARKVKLSSCDGITKVDSVDLKGITATETELRMIEAALKQGVIV